MKTQFQWLRRAAFIAGLPFLAIPALATPHPDPKVVGLWRGTERIGAKARALIDFNFKADGTGIETVNASGQIIQLRVTYTVKTGRLTLIDTSATLNGQGIDNGQPSVVNYRMTRTTLILNDNTKYGRIISHRVKS